MLVPKLPPTGVFDVCEYECNYICTELPENDTEVIARDQGPPHRRRGTLGDENRPDG